MSSICFSIGIVCCSNNLQSLLPADSIIFDCFCFFVLFFMFSGGPIWPYLFVVPDFGATLVTPSIWVRGGGGGYLAVHICGAGF